MQLVEARKQQRMKLQIIMMRTMKMMLQKWRNSKTHKSLESSLAIKRDETKKKRKNKTDKKRERRSEKNKKERNEKPRNNNDGTRGRKEEEAKREDGTSK